MWRNVTSDNADTKSASSDNWARCGRDCWKVNERRSWRTAVAGVVEILGAGGLSVWLSLASRSDGDRGVDVVALIIGVAAA